jgi:hypothetical protein
MEREVKESAQNFGNKAKEFANTRGKAFAKDVSETAPPRRTWIRSCYRGIVQSIFFYSLPALLHLHYLLH